MKKEIKISLPLYKIVYAVFCVLILSFIRGVAFTYEVGIALEPPMAMLAAVFCADTYAQEIVSRRTEIQRLYPMKKRVFSIVKRIAVQQAFLWALSMIGYGLFFVFQKPYSLDTGSQENEINQFFLYSGAIFVTLAFWGILSNTLACLLQNMWFGIGGCLILWLITNSGFGASHLKVWNVFSYTFRNVENSSDFGWLCGKMLCLLLCIMMMATLPKILNLRTAYK